MKARTLWKWWLGAALAMSVVTSGAGVAAAAALPCNPTVVQNAGVTYCQCGQTYYVQAYGGSGPIYMPVPPPQ